MYDGPFDGDENGLNQGNVTAIADKALIVNGHIAEGLEFPWQVSVQGSDGTHRCGASVINSNLLLCAAHCFSG